ncbi:hypothetical protein EON65_41880 [archaeon]|nr:MAG: hypothetical protein EON65_41880 [archaeon]
MSVAYELYIGEGAVYNLANTLDVASPVFQNESFELIPSTFLKDLVASAMPPIKRIIRRCDDAMEQKGQELSLEAIYFLDLYSVFRKSVLELLRMQRKLLLKRLVLRRIGVSIGVNVAMVV